MNEPYRALEHVLDQRVPVYVQAHDFPDHDAIGSGYALQQLLTARGYTASLCYGGRIDSHSLLDSMDQLGVDPIHVKSLPRVANGQRVLVDGFSGSSLMTELDHAPVRAVVDHHRPPAPPETEFSDIRPEYGSCSTIIFEYYKEAGVPFGRRVATALLMGIMMDTAFMTRAVQEVDMNAFSELFFLADWQSGSRLLKNSLSLSDLTVYREAFERAEVSGEFCFIPLSHACTPELSALIADFFLTFREIRFVAVLVPDRDGHRIQVRSENNHLPADSVIRMAMQGIGTGGGHVHMGGGTVPADQYPGANEIRRRFESAITAGGGNIQ